MADLPVSRIVATKGCLALIVGAGLIGAAGVALAAVAAHKIDSPALVTASSMLMIHAAAVVAISSWRRPLSSTLAMPPWRSMSWNSAQAL